VELHREELTGFVPHALDRVVVRIAEPHLPVRRKLFLHCETMILRCNDALARWLAVLSDLDARLVCTTVAVRQLECVSADCEREQLVPKTDAECRKIFLECNANLLDRCRAALRIAGTIADEHCIVRECALREIVIPWETMHAHS